MTDLAEMAAWLEQFARDLDSGKIQGYQHGTYLRAKVKELRAKDRARRMLPGQMDMLA